MVIAIQKLKLGKNIEAKLLMIRLESDTERYAFEKSKWFPKWAGNSAEYCNLLSHLKLKVVLNGNTKKNLRFLLHPHQTW